MGEESEKGLKFCPWKLIRRYPVTHGNNFGQEEVGEVFKTALFENRVWDIFFMLDPGENNRDPLLLVPSSQFEEIIDYVSSQVKIELSVPKGQAGEKFTLTFGDRDMPVPRFLGRVESEEALEELKSRIPMLPKDDLRNLSATTIYLYKRKMDKIYSSVKSGGKKKPEATREKRLERQKGYGRMIKRAQRYLGIRDRFPYDFISRRSLPTWDVEMLPPFKPKESVRFVCVDVEAWERSQHVITEVGFAVLDTEDAIRVPPGKDGRDWFHLIKSYHFRIREHLEKVNHQFIHGCPHLFNFGDSEFIYAQDIHRMITTIIGGNESKDKRPVVMVGHDIGQDLNYLQRIGFNIWREPHFLDEIDTKSMFQRMQKSTTARGLAALCGELGIPASNFHNAGNDATYTLRAMITMAVRKMVEKPVEGEDGWVDKLM
ncbi:hypothetical protein F4804DRAFT_345888 [Jackrogersella minutella]|nr:hypothetical protein F4804DRAFT_345888 [Jackrogersella minutella]